MAQGPDIVVEEPPEGLGKVLVVAAHPDDVDFGLAGSVAVWRKAGVEVRYCIVTDGDAGGSDRSVSRPDMARIRRLEQQEAAAEVGVDDVVFLGYGDGRVAPSLELRRDVSREIRRMRPDRVVCQSPDRIWDRLGASHPDHLAAGEATVCAVYPDARNPFAHPELLEEGLEPWAVPQLWLMAAPETTHVVDVTDTFDRKMAALRCHRSQIADPVALETRVRGWLADGARRAGLPEGASSSPSGPSRSSEPEQPVTASDQAPPLHEDVRSIVEIAEVGPDRFSGRTPPSPVGRVFGGIVVAQALMAAQRSVGPSGAAGGSDGVPALRLHSLHGYFLNRALPDSEVSFSVEPLRDSRSFALRQVTTVQSGEPRARFLCSFHIDEQGETDYQLAPPTAIEPPDAIAPSGGPMLFDIRVAEPVPAGDGTYLSSGRHWVRVKDRLPDDPALHLCLLGYFSDQTRLSFRPYTEEAWGTHTDVSLDHAVWFHRPARADRWLRYELQALSARGNRASVRGLMYDEDGALVMSMAQELLVRPIPGAEPQTPPWRLGAS